MIKYVYCKPVLILSSYYLRPVMRGFLPLYPYYYTIVPYWFVYIFQMFYYFLYSKNIDYVEYIDYLTN